MKNILKIAVILILFFITFTTVSNASEEQIDVTSNFKDENLRQAILEIVREVTKDPNKTNITIGDINKITSDNLPSGKQLHLAGKGIKSLEGLELFSGKNIEWIYLDWNEIADISILSRFTSLTKISMSSNKITDITPLAKLTNLVNLNISNNQISSLEPIKNLTNIQYIYADNNKITEITALSKLTNAKEISVSGNQITNIDLLTKLPNLYGLDASRNNIANIENFQINTHITNMNLNYNNLSTLQGIQNIKNLQIFSASNNKIVDITPITDLRELYNLNLNANKITDITKINKMKQLEYLYLDANNIIYVQAIDELPNLKKVTLYNQTYEFIIKEQYNQEDLQINLTDYFIKLKETGHKLYEQNAKVEIQNSTGYTLAQDWSYIIIKQSDLQNKPIIMKIYDNENSYITFTIKQEIPQQELASTIYTIENKYVKNVPAKTTKEVFNQNVNIPVEILRNDKALQNTQIVATKDVVKLNSKSYIIIVDGDITKDGLVNIFDIMKIKRKVIGLVELDVDTNMAADITKDGNVNIMDVMKMLRMVSNETN